MVIRLGRLLGETSAAPSSLPDAKLEHPGIPILIARKQACRRERFNAALRDVSGSYREDSFLVAFCLLFNTVGSRTGRFRARFLFFFFF